MTIEPYTLHIADEQLDDLRSRITQTRWPEPIKGQGCERGVPLDYLQKIASYWEHSFDWRQQEAAINQHQQYMAHVDGQPIHFFHIRSDNSKALPLLLMHGWPSSSIEYMDVIEPLRQHFHLVIPTIPGFGLSSPVQATGWQSPRTAQAYKQLMAELGYGQYGAHGSDIGGDILSELSKIDGEHLIGAHNATDTQTLVLSVAMFMNGGDPSENPQLSAKQKTRVKEIQAEWEDGMGYLQIQSTRPLTIGYGLHDSPVMQLAWQIEKYKAWTQPAEQLPEDKLAIDRILANISLYWFTGAGASSAQYIWENMHAVRDWTRQSRVPTGQAVFGAEDIARPLMDPDHNVSHWHEYAKGRHFPAMEEPKLLAKDIQMFFDTLTPQ